MEEIVKQNTTVNLGIKKLKRELRLLLGDTRHTKALIRRYKKRAWLEYAGVVRHRGSFPTHNLYKATSVPVTGNDIRTEIEVKRNAEK